MINYIIKNKRPLDISFTSGFLIIEKNPRTITKGESYNFQKDEIVEVNVRTSTAEIYKLQLKYPFIELNHKLTKTFPITKNIK